MSPPLLRGMFFASEHPPQGVFFSSSGSRQSPDTP